VILTLCDVCLTITNLAGRLKVVSPVQAENLGADDCEDSKGWGAGHGYRGRGRWCSVGKRMSAGDAGSWAIGPGTAGPRPRTSRLSWPMMKRHHLWPAVRCRRWWRSVRRKCSCNSGSRRSTARQDMYSRHHGNQSQISCDIR
jgi:hypothetical protein